MSGILSGEARRRSGDKAFREQKERSEYFFQLKNSSVAGFPVYHAEELEIQACPDYSVWPLSAAECDMFMHALLTNPAHHMGWRPSVHRHKRSHS